MMNHKDIIHLTDLSFQKFCEENFGVNRGVYNTIEKWFYERGVNNIIKRRLVILKFLNYAAYRTIQSRNSKVRFGHGGLKNCLDEFMVKHKNSRQTI